MITIIYSTNKDDHYNDYFDTHIKNTVGIKDVQIIKFINKNEFSLSSLYNKGINQSIYDIVVCIHNDVKLEKNWGKKLLNDFKSNPEFGIIGKAGSCYFPESGVYWEKMNETMVGQVYHHPKDGKKFLSKYSPKFDFIIPVVTIDGLFISFDKTKIKHKFDETIGKFHFYDHLFCLPNFLDGVKIGVTSSFEITHESIGRTNQEFEDSRKLFIEKYSNTLPIKLLPNTIYTPSQTIKKQNIKPKVAVIIPTKSNTNLLFDCITSFINFCKNKNYKIFIADTGSTDSEKNEIKKFIDNNINSIEIKFIEYDYYNFSKINNDVVKNHIDNTFTHLLFCNNDIKLLSDVISNMLNVFSLSNNVGTVGGRLHFEDNTVQHNGIVILYSNSNKRIDVTHLGLNSYYNYSPKVSPVIGNTGALLMVRKNVFEKIGMFNEEYIECFEDVELNLKCVINGYENYLDGYSVAFHYESKTRNKNPNKISKLQLDFINRLNPFIIRNIEKLKHKIIYIK
jgi:GT2 family glycosyltransferase